jgi:hypothetical protein
MFITNCPLSIQSVDLATVSVKTLTGILEDLDYSQKEAMLRQCSVESLNQLFLSDEKNRIALAKVIVACLPDSIQYLEEMLSRKSTLNDYELQFSFFCFLDEAPESQDRQALLQNVEKYLRRVELGDANAAWMAGDLLGDHWDPKESLTPLVDVAINGTWPAGREGAIHGLSCLLERLDVNQPEHQGIFKLLGDIKESDPVPSVREYASFVLESAKRDVLSN